jgi:hypothetical protein
MLALMIYRQFILVYNSFKKVFINDFARIAPDRNKGLFI